MRSWIDGVSAVTQEQAILKENKRQYMQMMQVLVNAGAATQDNVNADVANARKLLKRNDRIVWYLKWERLSYLVDAVSAIEDQMEGVTPEERQYFEGELEVLNKLSNKYGLPSVIGSVGDFVQQWQFDTPNMKHILSMIEKAPQMNDIVWDGKPKELAASLDAAEQVWQANRDKVVDVDDGIEMIMKVGPNQAWFDLKKSYCDAEGSAMGHCGNNQGRTGNETVLSFRTIISEEEHMPHLTFILDEDGRLGEMKGRGNQKPNEKYHPAIVKLLMSDIVNGIKGGGHDPVNNFAVADLGDKQADQLYARKPELMNAAELYHREGFTSRVQDRIEAEGQAAHNMPSIVSVHEDHVVVEEFTDFNYLVSSDFPDELEEMYDLLMDNVVPDFEDFTEDFKDAQYAPDVEKMIMSLLDNKTKNILVKSFNVSPDRIFDGLVTSTAILILFKMLFDQFEGHHFTEKEIVDTLADVFQSQLNVHQAYLKHNSSFAGPVEIRVSLSEYIDSLNSDDVYGYGDEMHVYDGNWAGNGEMSDIDELFKDPIESLHGQTGEDFKEMMAFTRSTSEGNDIYVQFARDTDTPEMFGKDTDISGEGSYMDQLRTGAVRKKEDRAKEIEHKSESRTVLIATEGMIHDFVQKVIMTLSFAESKRQKDKAIFEMKRRAGLL